MAGRLTPLQLSVQHEAACRSSGALFSTAHTPEPEPCRGEWQWALISTVSLENSCQINIFLLPRK